MNLLKEFGLRVIQRSTLKVCVQRPQASLHPGQFKRRFLSPELISPCAIACKVLWVQFTMVVMVPQCCRWAFRAVPCWSKSYMDWLNHHNWSSLCVLDLSWDFN